MSILPNILNKSVSFTRTFARSIAYKSAISLSNLYPQSSLKLTTVEKPIFEEGVDFNGVVPMDQLDITYSRSSGPGGQNVNKVNTKVDVRFHLESANWLSDKVKSKVLEKYHSKLTKEGNLVFRSDLTRSQQLNLADCLQKIRKCIRESLYVKPEPSPETEEKIRRNAEKANRERLAFKRERGLVKRLRQGLDY
ncbi:peptidyl-tRNA hydrolase ICT1, mitochondrial [Sitophilus oryzae]|uniref:Large ribosomal subunit protein mL62 n=1 Tax=Sitophilus oryzae TaxID=7048 RepID=A0A6J2Y642_SITOR|nr:peptidyl-tRNA hydrolase ICT1, mitochondrial [Sitophilus oryzae]